MAEMVQKESGGAILNHWALAISCILLMISGFAFLFHLEGIASVFGGFNAMKTIHNWVGVIFCVSLLFTMFQYLGDSLKYDADDAQWFKVAGGYLSHKVKVPPMGKHNPGQKLYYLGIALFGVLIALSGFGIWLMKGNATIMLLSHLMHNVAFIFFCIMVPVHIYLSTLANPGTLQIMLNGKVPLALAKKRYPKWVKAMGKM